MQVQQTTDGRRGGAHLGKAARVEEQKRRHNVGAVVGSHACSSETGANRPAELLHGAARCHYPLPNRGHADADCGCV